MATRNIRREAMDKAKAMKKTGELTEDTQKTMEEDVQKLTDKYIKIIDAAVEEKQKEIKSVDVVRGTFCRPAGEKILCRR